MTERILVTGATGQLGPYVVRELLNRRHEVVGWSGSTASDVFGLRVRPVDLTEPNSAASAFREAAPTHVIHSAAFADVGKCYQDPVQAKAVNHLGAATLAELAAEAHIRFTFVSTDLVFDGEYAPYREGDSTTPISVYGRTKADAENAVLAFSGHSVVRVSLLFGPQLYGRQSFFTSLTADLMAGRRCKLFADEWRTPTGLAVAANALIEIAMSDVTGILHVGGPERMSRLEMGQRLAAHLKVDLGGIESVSRATAPGEPRPRDTSLDSSRWRGLFPQVPWPTFETALAEMGLR